jgi:DNA-directed RNA polymerase subunit omega
LATRAQRHKEKQLTLCLFYYIIIPCKEEIVEKLDFIDSKFRLVLLAAKRGKQLLAGAKKRVDTTAENPLTIALEEIFRGKVKFRILEENEQIKEEEASSLMLGNEEEVIEYESNAEEMLYKEDEDREDLRRDDF